MEGQEALVTLAQIKEAHQRLQKCGMVVRTPVLQGVQAMFPQVGNVVLHLKLENMQTTGSFKIRGVVNQLEEVAMTTDLSNRMLITMSAGNYGKAFAYYLQNSGHKGMCVMPLTVPDNRVALLKMSELDKVSAPMMPHPHDFIKKSNVDRCNPWMPEYEVQNK